MKKHAVLVARGDQLQAWGKQFEDATDRLFALWHDFKAEKMTRGELARAVTPVRLAVARLVVRGIRALDPRLAATSRASSAE
jgi:hypothetical protein